MKKKLLMVALAASFAAHVALAAGDAPAMAPALKGEVLEVIDVQAYTYLRLKTKQGEVWAAVNKAPVKKGAEVTIYDGAVMADFKSAALNRTFPEIVFGTLGVAAPEDAATANAPAHGSGNMGQMHGNIAKSVDVPNVKVAKADGPDGRTVAEVNANRVALKDKTVMIRAKVVKVNAGVMGKNWVHLRDGSGSSADASNDLLATSQEEPKVGDVVLAKGVVKTDVDLGSGYTYKVLVENVSFQR